MELSGCVHSPTELMSACEQGDMRLVEKLLRGGADVNTRCDHWRSQGTALDAAIRGTSKATPKILELLLANHARMDMDTLYDPFWSFFDAAHHIALSRAGKGVLRQKLARLAKAGYRFKKLLMHHYLIYEDGGPEALALLVEQGARIDFSCLERAHTAYFIAQCLKSAIPSGRVLKALKVHNPQWYEDAATYAINEEPTDDEELNKAEVVDVLLAHGFQVDLTGLSDEQIRLLTRAARTFRYESLGSRLQREKPRADIVFEELL